MKNMFLCMIKLNNFYIYIYKYYKQYLKNKLKNLYLFHLNFLFKIYNNIFYINNINFVDWAFPIIIIIIFYLFNII